MTVNDLLRIVNIPDIYKYVVYRMLQNLLMYYWACNSQKVLVSSVSFSESERVEVVISNY